MSQNKTRFINLFLFITSIVLAFSNNIYSITFAGGSGTKDDPYQISNIDQLQMIDNEEYRDKHFKLINDIDASKNSSDWVCSLLASRLPRPREINGSNAMNRILFFTRKSNICTICLMLMLDMTTKTAKLTPCF